MAGLGWGLSKDYVARIPGGAASDMNVFLVLSGNVYPLVKTESDESGDVYVSQAYEHWVIRYVTASERWLVIKENGVRYVFGGLLTSTTTDKCSVGDSIEWVVKRGNWIGNSIAGGQEQLAMVWNLSAVEDQWGNRLQLVYEQTLAYAGTWGQYRRRYTRSCRLSQIVSSDGEKLVLEYAAKGSSEYAKPHQIKSSKTVCKLSGVLRSGGRWDSLSAPDPRITVTVMSGSTVLGTYDQKEKSGAYTVPFSFDLPASTPDVITVRFQAWDVDWPDSDDLMLDTTVTLECNSGVQTSGTVVLSRESAAVDIEYIHTVLTPGGADAFQDRYEESYLRQVRLCDDAGSTVVATRLDYGFLGSGACSKRVLTTVSRYNAREQLYEAPQCFEYGAEADGVSAAAAFNGWALYGAIKSRTLSSGAKIAYRYDKKDIASAPLDIAIERPQGDSSQWVEPTTYMGPGYAVVIWQGKSGGAKAGKIHATVYAWVGSWAVNPLGEASVAKKGQMTVRLGPDFVAVGLTETATPLLLLAQDPLDDARWTSSTPIVSPALLGVAALVEVGAGFAALLTPSNGTLRVFEKSGTDWIEQSFPLQSGKLSRFTLAARDHYVFALSAAEDNSYPPFAYVFHRLKPSSWALLAKSVDTLWDSDVTADHDHGSEVHSKSLSSQCNATSVAVQARHDALLVTTRGSSNTASFRHVVFRWDEDFADLTCEPLGEPMSFLRDAAEPNVTLTVVEDTFSIDIVFDGILGALAVNARKHVFRFLGTGWERVELQNDDVSRSYHGSDACSTTWNGEALYHQFDPNVLEWRPADGNSWQPYMPPYPDGNPTLFERWWPILYFVEGIVTLPLEWAGVLIDLAFLGVDLLLSQPHDTGAAAVGIGRYYTANNQVYYQDNYGEWTLLDPLAQTYQGKDLGGGVYEEQSLSTQSTQNASRYVSYVVTINRYTYVTTPSGDPGVPPTTSKVSQAGYPKKVHRVQFLRNGQLWGDPIDLPDGQSIERSDGDATLFVGPECFFSYSGGSTLAQATGLHLYRIDRRKFQGAQTAYVVSAVDVDDGFTSRRTEHAYDTTDAVPSASGGKARFGKVTTYFKGALAAPAKTNGYRESYFYTRSATPPLSPQPADDLRKYASLFSGVGYATRVCGPNDQEIALLTQRFEVFEVPLMASLPGYYLRPTVRTAVVEGTRTVSEDTFSLDTKGLPARSAIVSYDISGAATTVVTEYAYAFQQTAYARETEKLNLLNQVCLQTRTVGDQTTSIEAVRYASSGQRRSPSLNRNYPTMAPVRTYKALRPGVAFAFGSGTVDTSAWLCTGGVVLRSADSGIVTEAVDLTADQSTPLVKSTVYDRSYRFALATFLGASVASGQAGYYGYQSYEDTTPWNLTATGGVARVEPKSFVPRDGAYVVSAYVQPRKGGSGGSIGFGSSKKSLTCIDGSWQYVEYVTTAPSAASKPFAQCDGLIRDFRFSPVDAPFAATGYDASTGRITSRIDNNGLKVDYHVDDRLRPVAQVEPQGTVHRLFWQVEGARTQTAYSPRQHFVISNRSGGTYVAALEYAQSTTIVTQDRGNSAIQMETKAALDASRSPSVEVGVQIGNVKAVYDNRSIRLYDGSHLVTSTAPPSAPFSKWVLVALDTKVWLWLDDKPFLQHTFQSPVSGDLRVIASGGDRVTYQPQEIYAGIDPVISAVYADALGRAVQTQSLNDDASGRVVEQTIYDGWGNAAIRTKPMLYNDLSWGYQPKCVTALDGATGRMEGDVVTFYQTQPTEVFDPDDPSYPYASALAEDNPMARTIATGLPGKDFLPRERFATRRSYGPNADVSALYARLNLSAHQADFTPLTIYTPNGQKAVSRVSLVDRTRNLVATSMGGAIGTTQATYTDGLLTTTYLPPAVYQGSISNELEASYSSVQRYDFLQHPATRVTGDTGTTNLVCDYAGRVRFTQTAEQIESSPRTVVCCKYDALGRILERGLLTDTAWDRAALTAQAADPTYPDPDTPGYEWRERYQYDITESGDARNLKYRLYKSVKRGPSSGQVVETFAYDAYGHVVSTTLLVESVDVTPRQTDFTYDAFGNVTSIAYPRPAGSAAKLTVTHELNLLGRVKSIGIKGAPEKFAAYAYDLQGRLAWAFFNSRKVARAYTYDFQGHLKVIEDRVGTSLVFREILQYDDFWGNYLGGQITRAICQGEAVSPPSDLVYGYDQQGWLVYANRIDESGDRIGYDAQGNILHLKNARGVRDATYAEGKNQIATLDKNGQGPTAFSYTPNGAIRSSDKVSSVVYDPLALQPIRYQIGDAGSAVSFEYDCRMQRVVKSVSGAQARLYLRGAGPMPLAEIAGAEETQYVHGPLGLCAVIDGRGTVFISSDHLGSTRAVTDESGGVAESFQFDPFGSMLAGSSPAGGRVRYLFTGQEHDHEADLYNYRLRLYDQDTGVFYAPDPAGEYYSPYTYTRNDPINLTDPTGAASLNVLRYSIHALETLAVAAAGGLLGGLGGAAYGAIASGQLKKEDALLGACVGAAGLGLIRAAGAIGVEAHRAWRMSRIDANAAFPLVIYDESTKFCRVEVGRAAAEAIAQSEGIHPSAWGTNLVSQRELSGVVERIQTPQFDGRVILVGHGNGSNTMEGLGGIALRGSDVKFHFLSKIDPAAIRRVDLMVCFGGVEGGFGEALKATLAADAQTAHIEVWGALRATVSSFHAPYIGTETQNILKDMRDLLFPMFSPGHRLDPHMAVDIPDYWREIG